MGAKVDYQVAAPTEMRTSNLHRAKNLSIKECGWKDGDRGGLAQTVGIHRGEEEKKKRKKKKKKDMTLTCLLMEGVRLDCSVQYSFQAVAVFVGLAVTSSEGQNDDHVGCHRPAHDEMWEETGDRQLNDGRGRATRVKGRKSANDEHDMRETGRARQVHRPGLLRT